MACKTQRSGVRQEVFDGSTHGQIGNEGDEKAFERLENREVFKSVEVVAKEIAEDGAWIEAVVQTVDVVTTAPLYQASGVEAAALLEAVDGIAARRIAIDITEALHVEQEAQIERQPSRQRQVGETPALLGATRGSAGALSSP